MDKKIPIINSQSHSNNVTVAPHKSSGACKWAESHWYSWVLSLGKRYWWAVTCTWPWYVTLGSTWHELLSIDFSECVCYCVLQGKTVTSFMAEVPTYPFYFTRPDQSLETLIVVGSSHPSKGARHSMILLFLEVGCTGGVFFSVECQI